MIDEQKRVAIFLPALHEGGAERTMVNLSRGIAELGCNVDLVLARAEGPHLAEVSSRVRVVDLKASRTLTSLPPLVRYLRRERPGVMLSVMNHANIVALWARSLAGIPKRVVVNEQNTISHTTQDAASKRGRLMRQLVKRFYPWANDIVAVSRGAADDLAQVIGLPRERVKVIYNAVVTPDLQEKAKISVDHPWFRSGEPPVLMGAGRLRLQKDFASLIRAFAQVRNSRSARLLILGEGPERPALESLVKQYGLEQDVSLPGFIENPYAYMARAAIFILSSRWEGLPTVLIEALCCGTQVIATDCPSGPREILADGQYGQLVPVGDVDALTCAIESNLAVKGRCPTRESWRLFEMETIANQYRDMLLGS